MKKEIKCKWCGKTFHPNHHLTKYCSDECYNESVKESKRRYISNRRKNEYHYNIGTNNISPHANSDFKKEYMIIKNEKRRRGLR